MALTINTNISSLIAQRNLNSATTALNTSIERMTTGYKINHAADNAAGYSIANMWETQLGSLDVAADNAATGADMLTTVEETYGLLSSHLQRVRDLTEQAANGTYGSQSLRAIHSEIEARLQEVNRIAANAEFNGIKLMDGKGIPSYGINLQVGLHADSNSCINLAQSLFADASISGLFSAAKTQVQTVDNTVTSLNESLATVAAACAGMVKSGDKYVPGGDTVKAIDMLAHIDNAINEISERTTKIGAAQNRVDSALSSIDVQTQNLTSSLSTLRDTDIAQESSNYIQAQILQQASATLLSTANQLPSIALNLI